MMLVAGITVNATEQKLNEVETKVKQFPNKLVTIEKLENFVQNNDILTTDNKGSDHETSFSTRFNGLKGYKNARLKIVYGKVQENHKKLVGEHFDHVVEITHQDAEDYDRIFCTACGTVRKSRSLAGHTGSNGCINKRNKPKIPLNYAAISEKFRHPEVTRHIQENGGNLISNPVNKDIYAEQELVREAKDNYLPNPSNEVGMIGLEKIAETDKYLACISTTKIELVQKTANRFYNSMVKEEVETDKNKLMTFKKIDETKTRKRKFYKGPNSDTLYTRRGYKIGEECEVNKNVFGDKLAASAVVKTL